MHCHKNIQNFWDAILSKIKGGFMAKGKDTQKAEKKKSEKTLKEKRKEKKEKKAQKGKN